MNPTLLTLASALIFSTTLPAHTLPKNYNALANEAAAVNPASVLFADPRIDYRHRVQRDSHSQLPTFLWSAPQAINAAFRGRSATVTALTIEQAARLQLARYASIYQLSVADQNSASVQQQALNLSGKTSYRVRFGQRVNGIEVFARAINLLLDDAQQVTAISGHFAPQTNITQRRFNWSAPQALTAAFYDLHQQQLPTTQLKLHAQHGSYQWYRLKHALPVGAQYTLSKPARIKKIWFPLAQGLEPAYYIELSSQSTAVGSHDKAHYTYIISATNGALLLRNSMTHNDSAFTYRVWADQTTLMPYNNPYSETVFSTLSKPTLPKQANLLSLTCGLLSTCDPWLPVNARKTMGNNVSAYADITAPTGFNSGDNFARVNTANTFDYGYNFYRFDDAQHPKQLQAAIVQAFYTTNFMHDWLYDHGFDEKAGNGQAHNFRRGGLGGDRMRVEINDYSGSDNANMTTPLDGESATLQLFLWQHTSTTLSININGTAEQYSATPASFGLAQFNVNRHKLVLVDDGSAITSDGCQTPFVNAAKLVGAIALIERGACLFAEKAKNAQDAGAIALVIANNKSEAMVTMGGSDDATLNDAIVIPVLGVEQTIGAAIKQALALTKVTARLNRKVFPPYNSALDNSVIIHEWGHFLTQRLVWLDNNQGNALGEGWSDFLALLALVTAQDSTVSGNDHFQAAYSLGQYVSSAQTGGYYFGSHRYPYSSDLSKNPLTFKHISNGVALPINIVAAPDTDMSGSDNAEVHRSGEVWASMLWDAYSELLNAAPRLSFIEAQQRMLDYLVASLKITPANPTFLDARDALLAVVNLRDPADYQAFWRAFAKRGAGVNAKAPDSYSTSHIGVVEDYSTPAFN